MADNLLRDKIPTFDKKSQQSGDVSLANWSALSMPFWSASLS